jgi:hypothetical protein
MDSPAGTLTILISSAAFFILFGIASTLICATAAIADQIPRSFVGDFIGNDATPENYLSVSGSVDRAQNSESMYLEKTISPASSFSIFVGYQRFEVEEESTTSSNIAIGYKHILFSMPSHELLCTINPSIELPLGNRTEGSDSHARAGFDLLFQKGLGELPDSLRLLRPFGFEGGWGWESKVTGTSDDLTSADLELEYSFAYLDANVARDSVLPALRNLAPHLDFDYEQYLSAHGNSSAPSFQLTPGVAWLSSTFEINLGVQVALNRAASDTGSVAFVWLLGVSYDQIMPALGWTPFH